LEYFVGAAITMIVYIITNRIVRSDLKKEESVLQITYSQSHIYELMAPLLDYAPKLEESAKRQSNNFIKNSYMKVMVVKNKAYWIKDNTFYVADVLEGEVVKENAKKVDTMSMDKVELGEMMFIIETLRGDNNDTWSAGE
jgi:ribosomal 30S subunit maturation factor RimM